MKSTLLIVSLLGTICLSFQQAPSPYTYECQNTKCVKKLRDASNASNGTSMNVCKLNCDALGSLWPKPTGQVDIGKEIVALIPNNISLELASSIPEPVRNMLNESGSIFMSYLTKMSDSNPINQTGPGSLNKLVVSITVTNPTTKITLSVNESYTLQIRTSTTGSNSTVVAQISAPTFFGARHALETLSQLITYDEMNSDFKIISNANVTDKPVFPYRGIMLDTARNYFSVEKIKRLIDGMSYNKLSVFHWHITDSHSFPMEVPSRPKMVQYGVYEQGKNYSVQTIKDVVAYANQRGIKVIPELDQPAHSGYGYQWGAQDQLGDLVVCVDDTGEPWYDYCVEPPCGQLNIVNDNVTEVIGDIFTDMMNMFDKDIFHMGGDEVDFRCYNSTKQVTDWMTANNYTLTPDGFYRLWAGFQDKILQRLLNASGNNDLDVIMWTSGLTDPSRIETYLNKSRYIIQIWSESTDELIGGLLQKGYRTIFSNVDALYLDCGFQAWIGNGHNWCSPIKGWQTVYDNDPEKIYAKFTNDTVAGDAVRAGLIMGSETPLWTEQVDNNALESRIWPRGAAHSERMWSHPTTTHAEAEYRMVTNRDRMVNRGIDADRLQPEFCLQNQGKCPGPPAVEPPPETTSESGNPSSSTDANTEGTTTGRNAASIQTVSFTLIIGTIMMTTHLA